MELVQRSFQGGILILVILAARMLWLDRLPKRTFPVLWSVALVRLLAPFSVSSGASVYSFLQRAYRAANLGGAGETGNLTVNGGSNIWRTVQELTLQRQIPFADLAEEGKHVQLLPAIWCVGAILCGAFFVMSYLRSLWSFRRARPVEDEHMVQWLQGHRMGRKVLVRQSDRVCAPLTYGVFRPVILLPAKALWGSRRELEYILQHEYVHVRRWDGAVKLAMVAALCIHWFNPFVWAMAGLLNRDIELACDEGVLRRFGEQARAGYATALIGMEEKKRRLMPLYNGFSKNAIEERISLIMKYKKTKYVAAAAAVLLVAVIALLFATSAKTAEAKDQAPFDAAERLERDGTALEGIPLDPPKDSAASDLSGPDDGAMGAQRPQGMGYTLLYMQEGMLQEEPAELYVGQGYCLLIPVEGWEAYAPDAWRWEYDEQVRIWVSDCTGDTVEQAVSRLEQDGYSHTEEEGLLTKEEDGRLLTALICQGGNAVMCINYAYPMDSEYMEGSGSCLSAIAGNFTVLPKSGLSEGAELSEGSGLSEDSGQAGQTARAFWEAYLAGDRETMGRFLTEDCQDRDVFPDGQDGHAARSASVNAVKGLDMEPKAVGETCQVWIEFWPGAEADALEYLTLEMIKETDGWKIRSYGLEM